MQLNARLTRNDGFTTVAIMITLMLSSLLVVAAFATANNGIPLARGDQNTKQAYSAAEAGIAFYSYQLSQDPNYWTYCTNPPKPAVPNPIWNGDLATSRLWRDLPAPTGSPDKGPPGQYNVELLPAPGAVKCEDGLAATTFLNQQNGTFSILSTGRYRGRYRSIRATFRRVGFVDFLWFTDYETPDTLSYQPGDQNAALKACSGTYRRDGRNLNICNDQQFIAQDVMDGPMHTNDRFYTCGAPVFGATANDRIEASDPNEFEYACGVGLRGAGTKIASAPVMQFPPTNGDLASDTLNGWTFTGKTILHFQSNGTVKVTSGGVTQQLGLPSNNVIYVRSGTCNTTYQEAQHYNADPGCGDAWVDGTYPQSLTIGADNDIIVDGDLKRADPTSSAEMGLIANGFVRVYHPIAWKAGQQECIGSGDHSASDAMFNVEIDAAVLSLQHSFLVDNPSCGDPEGTLTVDGAIAQKYRGTVGTHTNNGTTIATGYAKNYKYDQSLRYADPPYFLDPVKTSWAVNRETEVVPADKRGT